MLSNVMNIRQVGSASNFRPAVIPVNDIRGLEGMNYSKSEKLLRCKLAAVYRYYLNYQSVAKLRIKIYSFLTDFRLIDLYGWSQSIYNHVTVSDYIITFEKKTHFFTSCVLSGTGWTRRRGIFAESFWNALQRNHSIESCEGMREKLK